MILISLLLLALFNLISLIAVLLLNNVNAMLLIVFNLLFVLVIAGLHFQKQSADQERHVSELNQLHEAIKKLNQEQFAWLDRMPDFLCLKDDQGRWLQAAPLFLAQFNLQNVDYLDKTDDELSQFPFCDARQLKLSSIQDKSAWHLGQAVKETKKITLSDGSESTLEITRTPVFDEHHNRIKLILTGRIEENHNKNDHDTLSQLLEACHLNVCLLDNELKITLINPKFSKLTGYVLSDVYGKSLSFLIKNDFNLTKKDFFHEDQGHYWSGELISRTKDGNHLPIKLDITEIKDSSTTSHYFATILDISHQKRAEQRIKQISHYDDLTGLPNRVLFFDRLSRFLSEASRLHIHTIVILINLDHFKKVNAALGHEAGNLAIKEVSRRLATLIGKQDVLGRLNSDEFAILAMNQKTHEQAIYAATIIAGGIQKKLADKLSISNQELVITASIGIAVFPEDGSTVETLLKNADLAMHEAKRQGRNNYQFYSKDQNDTKQDRLAMEMGLRRAIKNNELQLYYQPQYYTNSRKLFGAEVLIRWFPKINGRETLIPPDKFIGIAEESGLIVELGAWIMRMACLQFKNWMVRGYDLQQISVNVSPRQFNDHNFLDTVEEALREAQLDAGRLELEITESMLAGNTKQIELQLYRLKKRGLKIALDDFGTGYSSLSYLKNFPIDVLKIDQAFIREMTVESKEARLASAIIEMGHSLGQKIVAEGVETQEQLDYLTHRGCDVIQGYFFSPPLPVQKMTDLLAAASEEKLTLEPMEPFARKI